MSRRKRRQWHNTSISRNLFSKIGIAGVNFRFRENYYYNKMRQWHAPISRKKYFFRKKKRVRSKSKLPFPVDVLAVMQWKNNIFEKNGDKSFVHSSISSLTESICISFLFTVHYIKMVVENPKKIVGIHTTMIDLKGDMKFCTHIT